MSSEVKASDEDREVYEFAAKLVVNTAVDVAIIFGFAFLLGVLPSVMLAYCLVALLKYFAGGAHASKMLNCLITGVAVYLGIGAGARVLSTLPYSAAVCAFGAIGSGTLRAFLLFAPAVPPQKPLKSVRHRGYLRKGAVVSLFVILAAGITWLARPFASAELFWAGLLALVWQSLILLPGTQRLFDRMELHMF